MPTGSQDLYRLFGLYSSATSEELRDAYRSRMRELAAPDHGEFREPAVREAATLLAQAYNVLCGPSPSQRHSTAHSQTTLPLVELPLSRDS